MSHSASPVWVHPDPVPHLDARPLGVVAHGGDDAAELVAQSHLGLAAVGELALEEKDSIWWEDLVRMDRGEDDEFVFHPFEKDGWTKYGRRQHRHHHYYIRWSLQRLAGNSCYSIHLKKLDSGEPIRPTSSTVGLLSSSGSIGSTASLLSPS